MVTSKFAANEGRSARTLTLRASSGSSRPAVVPDPRPVRDRIGSTTPLPKPGPPPTTRSGSGSAQPIPRGHRLELASTAVDPVTVVQSGCVALFKALPGERSICIGILGPGDLFFHDRGSVGNEISVESLTDSVVLNEEFTRLVGVLSGSTPLVQAALTSLRRQASDMQDLVSRVLSRDITLRLAAMLLTLSDRFGQTNGDGTVTITIPVAHKMLARMIGSNRVTVTRVMTEMREAGMVKAPGRNQIVVDPKLLQAHLNGESSESLIVSE